MKMTHDGLSFASFREENSRSRSPMRIFLIRTGKRPALANVRALIFLCKEILGRRGNAFTREEKCGKP
jgi:hypothetical protein